MFAHWMTGTSRLARGSAYQALSSCTINGWMGSVWQRHEHTHTHKTVVCVCAWHSSEIARHVNRVTFASVSSLLLSILLCPIVVVLTIMAKNLFTPGAYPWADTHRRRISSSSRWSTLLSPTCHTPARSLANHDNFENTNIGCVSAHSVCVLRAALPIRQPRVRSTHRHWSGSDVLARATPHPHPAKFKCISHQMINFNQSAFLQNPKSWFFNKQVTNYFIGWFVYNVKNGGKSWKFEFQSCNKCYFCKQKIVVEL